jgi:NADH:ubiquinone oxidoreductase subunit 3 (subunit A)
MNNMNFKLNNFLVFFYTNSSFLNLLLFIIFTLFILFALFNISYYLMQRNIDIEKLSAYECGFDPFEESLGRFDIKFYIVAILFLIFDLEIVFLFPWSVILLQLPLFSFWIIFYFLFILIIGFIYEWKKGALDWN